MTGEVAATGKRMIEEEKEFGTRLQDLDWIDSFVESIKPYVRVRLEDGVLIKMPTEVYQVNQTGLMLLNRALAGEGIQQIARSVSAASSPDRVLQIHRFFCDVRDLLDGHLGSGQGRLATEVTPFQGSFTRYPVLSEIALTYRCNLACTFCYAGCGTPDAKPGNLKKEKYRNRWKVWQNSEFYRKHHPKRDPVSSEMSTWEVERVIDQIAWEAKVPSVSFTGGECTLRSDLPHLISHARTRGLRVNIITNGVLCASRSYVETLIEAGLTSAQVSIEGPDATVHEALTQRRGSFEKTLLGIRNLRDSGVHVHTNTTVCEENSGFLRGIVDLAKSLDLPHISMNHIIPTGTPNLRRHSQIRMSYTNLGPYILRTRDHADRAGVDFHWYSPTPFCIFNPIAHGLGNKGCAACDGLLHVSPSGEVLPCSSFARGVGNLLEEGFENVWFGKDAQYYKKKRMAHPICLACEHFALCQGACTLYWNEMGYGELARAVAKRFRRWKPLPRGE